MRMRIKYLFLLILLVTTANTNTIVSETTILGDWCAGSKNAFHEEFSLTIENGEHIFSSWLHHRPSESGKWIVKEQKIIIHTNAGLKYVYFIKKAISEHLILQQEGYEPETYVREGCLYVQLPRE